jgi:hypothetical protein
MTDQEKMNLPKFKVGQVLGTWGKTDILEIRDVIYSDIRDVSQCYLYHTYVIPLFPSKKNPEEKSYHQIRLDSFRIPEKQLSRLSEAQGFDSLYYWTRRAKTQTLGAQKEAYLKAIIGLLEWLNSPLSKEENPFRKPISPPAIVAAPVAPPPAPAPPPKAEVYEPVYRVREEYTNEYWQARRQASRDYDRGLKDGYENFGVGGGSDAYRRGWWDGQRRHETESYNTRDDDFVALHERNRFRRWY